MSSTGTKYRTGDEEFEIVISDSPRLRDGRSRREISLTRRLPDPTAGDAFDAFRPVKTTFGCFYTIDPSRAGISDIPKLRTALLAFLDTNLQNRIVAGEK